MRSTRLAVFAAVTMVAASCLTSPQPVLAETPATVEAPPVKLAPVSVDVAPAVSIDSVLVVAHVDELTGVSLRGERSAATSSDSLTVISIADLVERSRLAYSRPVESTPMISGRYRSSAAVNDSSAYVQLRPGLNRRTS